MLSETLRNIRTMRQVKTSLDLTKKLGVKTTNSLSKTEEEVAHLQSLSDRQIEQILAKERKRSAAVEAAIDKSRRRLIKAREKLAATINKNRALNDLRYELQRARWEGRDSVPSKKAPLDEGGNLRRMKLEY
jgi:predicted  nucleic acid-binding Zn-ribbon protein